MAREDFVTKSVGPDLIVSWNLQRMRRLRGWTQAEATERLAQFGLEWSVASHSDAERAWTPEGRDREFTATDLVALSLGYEVPLSWWLLPPPVDERGDVPFRPDGIDEPFDDTLLRLTFSSSPEIQDRLTALGVPITLADDDVRHLRALLDSQESQLEDWLREVRDARASMGQHSDSPSKKDR